MNSATCLTSLVSRALGLATAVMLAVTAVPAAAHAQKALVFCPVSIDVAGCDNAVAALKADFPDGVDRGYDGTSGTVDVKTVDLWTYAIFVVPSLADGNGRMPYALLRDSTVKQRLHDAIMGRVALWSGTPDQGTTNRDLKDALIKNLARWANGNYAAVKGPGLVAFQDLSDSVSGRYGWVRGLTGLTITPDSAVLSYASVRTMTANGTAILNNGSGSPIAYANMASLGFYLPQGAAGVSLDAVGQTGTTRGGQIVLLTSPGGNSGKAVVKTDKDDYAPGTVVTITGTGFQPGETVTLGLREDPEVHAPTVITAVADANGAFVNTSFSPEVHDIDVRFILTAVGGTSAVQAQTTFTDGTNTTASAAAQSPSSVTAGGQATFTVTLTRENGSNGFTATVSAVGLTGGAAAAPVTVSFDKTSTTQTANLIVTTTSSTVTQKFAINANGVSIPATLTLVPACTAPAITAQPQGATKTVGDQAAFSVAASGTGLSYQWRKDNVSIPNATTNTYTIQSVGIADAGSYDVVVSGGCGSITSSGGSLAVNKAAATVTLTLTSLSQAYDGTAKSVAATTSASGSSSFGVTYNGAPTGPTAAGSYAVVATLVNDSYTGSASGTLVIKEKAATAIIADLSREYGAPNPTTGFALASSSGLINGDQLACTSYQIAATATSTAPVGSTHAITATCTNANYTVTVTPGSLSITKKAVTASITASNKVYDGNATATATGSLTGALSGDAVSLAITSASFADKNVGNAKTVTASGLTLTGAAAGNYALSTITTATTTANITAAPLTASITADGKPYDGTTAASTSNCSVATKVGTDDVGCTTSGATFSSANVGSQTVTATVVLGGAAKDNYALTSATASASASISARALTASITAADKQYDGNVDAAIVTRMLGTGVVGSDAVTLSGGTATFNDKNVGTGKTVSATGLTLTGAAAGNYTVGTTATTTASISAKALAATITAPDKVYDGNATASSVTASLGTGLVSGDNVTVTAGTATFDSKNVGTRTVTAPLTFSGSDVGNYATSATATAPAKITAASVTGHVTAADKTYDATTTATITNPTLTGGIGSDAVTLTVGAGAFADKNVGAAKPVTATGLSITGGDAGNYALSATTAMATASITPVSLTGSITASSKIYDGTKTATLTASTPTGVLGTDHVSFTAGTATFADKNVGTAKTVTATGLSLTGDDASNYILGSIGTAKADITARALAISATGVNKTYDGTVAATVTLGDDRISGDALSTAYTGATFADRNVGTGKAVTVAGISVTGADAGNYAPNGTISTTASITAKALTASATATDKVYDGTTAATASVTTDKLAGDMLTTAYTSAVFADKNVGSAKPVAVNGITISGTDVGNYELASPTATAHASIAQAGLTVATVASTRIYGDANPAFAAGYSGFVSGEDNSVLGGTLGFTTSAKPASAVGDYDVTANGLTSGNYNITFAAGKLTIAQAPLTITTAASTKVYGDANPAFTGAIVGIKNGDGITASYTTSATGTSDVGRYDIVPAAVDASSPKLANYAVTLTNGSLSVTQKGLTVTANSGTKLYGAALPTFAASYTGFVLSQNESVLGGTLKFASEASAASHVGSYDVTPEGVTSSNYAIQFAKGTLAVTKAPLTVTADEKTRVYGGANPQFTASYTGFVLNESATNLTTQVAFGGDATTAGINADVGDHTITPSGATSADYDVSFVGGKLKITPAALTVAANGATRVYGDANPALDGTLTGVVAGDKITATYSTTAALANAVGSYPITPTLVDPDGRLTNYDATPTNGALTITAAALVVTPANATRIFGAANPTFTGAVTGIKNSDAITAVYATGATPASNVGSYDITATLSDPSTKAGNYSVTLNKGALTISQATPTIVWATPAAVPQGTALSSEQLKATTTGVTGQPVTGGFTYVPPAGTLVYAVGSTDLKATFTSGDKNYTGADSTVHLSVTNVAPVVTSITLGADPIALRGPANIVAAFTDPGMIDTHTATITWDDGSTSPGTVSGRAVSASHTYTAAGVYTITVTVTDNNGGSGTRVSSVETIGYVVVYDPSAGFVTGGGWINSPPGACKLSTCNENTTGKANFGFNAQYKKGQQIPDGNTEFQFQAGGLNFKSTAYSWLVVAGSKAQYKGTGTINGQSGYSFMLTAIDGDMKAKGNPDAFRIKIWNAGGTVYDNQMLMPDDSGSATNLGGGSIVIHQ